VGSKRTLDALLKHIRTRIARRVHDPRVQNRLQFGSALGLGVGLGLTLLLLTGILGVTPTRLSDLLYQAPPPSGNVVIVAIDAASVKQIGDLPWERATIAALIETIARAHPRVVGLDLILVEPSKDDALLAQALERVPSVVEPIIGVGLSRFPARAGAFPRFDVTLAPARATQTARVRLGHTVIAPDSDGVVRRVPLAIAAGGRNYPAFGLAALEAYASQSAVLQIENNQVAFGALALPVDAQGQMPLNFFSPTAPPTLSAADVLRGQANLAGLRDKIVLIGMTGSIAPESFKTPLSDERSFSTVEIQADLIETIISARLLVEQDRLTQVVMIFLLAILAGATLPHVRLLSAAALTIIYFLLYLGYAFSLFNRGVIVQPLYPVLALAGAFLGAMTFRYFFEERQRASITRLLRRHVAPDAVDQVTDRLENGALPLEGIRRAVSVLAIDLGELEGLAGALTPQALIRLLDQHGALIVAAIFRRGGSVLKHTGNSIVATWNLLTDQPDHARAAVRAAMEIREDISAFNQKQPKELVVKVGMGVATGCVIAGRIGASTRAEYTILGEAVGMAERIALKPERGICVDAATRELIGKEFDTREVNPVRLRHRTEPLLVWQLITPVGLEEPLPQEATDASESAK